MSATNIPLHVLEQTVKERFHGKLSMGSHRADSVACLLEAAHVAIGDSWSDTPDRWPDLRPINDLPFWVSDTARATALVPVLIAYWDWEGWSDERRITVMSRVAIATVQQIVAQLPKLPDEIQQQCQRATTLIAAAKAASAAARAVAWVAAARAARAGAEAAWAVAGVARAGVTTTARAASAVAGAAARAAGMVAEAMGEARAAETVLIQACTIWIDADRGKEREK